MASPGGGLSKSLAWRVKLFSLANKTSVGASRNNPFTYMGCMCKSYSLYRKHGFLPDEAMKLGLLNSKDGVEGNFISKIQLVARQKFLNHPSFQEMTEDKAVFYTFCSRMGLPTPRLLALFFSASSGMQWGQRPLAGESQWVDFFDNYCPPEFVVKPSLGVYGEGILFVEKNSPGYSGAELFRTLQTHPKYHSFVIQECLQNHPAIMAISPKRGLQTVRVITFVKEDLSVEILMAYLKPIVGENRIDNHSKGFTGNLLCQINLSDGTLGDLVMVGQEGVIKLEAHPDTGSVFKGQKMPLWDELCGLARSAAKGFLPMRAIGWDVAVTPEGPLIIEGNARWDPPKFGNIEFLMCSMGDSEKV
ncbi:Sugar-transfer associated ATP-grasp [Geoalkalibacter ferrihydriticus]|uniref:Alpha-L-glutamate ligase-related protein ATP-grasp domain-containing protein n=2 Tax=Geoalkalibacter ferrihydriticus TaxID=392333 RepID=A0A0C2HKD2_9BACT|nr:sugar-transfer associated ATP-grasp domain-containing protein [Geoalkalibacter ferrihydriticus]KIH75480.1 hypothetical protein GFER_16105 [Geoalkalibacter ferrihydriticus DSM 17813]SDM84221.1 Sugar-transfer associated ATP-grasp [Geoalkalibacter ferrihydriticus]